MEKFNKKPSAGQLDCSVSIEKKATIQAELQKQLERMKELINYKYKQ